ncbi:MAG: hypothetical protein KDB80_14795, partial [Planctomycetes bacterium]|nr:hypothetical protein [Planctomycetota bacterium]
GLLAHRSAPRWIAILAIALSPVLFLLAFEQTGAVPEAVLSAAVDFGLPLLALWHFAAAWWLVARSPREQTA